MSEQDPKRMALIAEIAKTAQDIAAKVADARDFNEMMIADLEAAKSEASARREMERAELESANARIRELEADREILARDAREVRDAAMKHLPGYVRPGETAAGAIERVAQHLSESLSEVERLTEALSAAEKRADQATRRCEALVKLDEASDETIRVWHERASKAERERDDLARTIAEATAALGPAWMHGGATLAEGIQRKTTALERLGSDGHVGAAVLGVLADFGWDHAVVRGEVESERHADSVMGCILVALERAMRPADFTPAAAATCEGCGGTGVRHWRDGDAPCFQCQPTPSPSTEPDAVPEGHRRVWIRIAGWPDEGGVASLWEREPEQRTSTLAIVVVDLPIAPTVRGAVVGGGR